MDMFAGVLQPDCITEARGIVSFSSRADKLLKKHVKGKSLGSLDDC